MKGGQGTTKVLKTPWRRSKKCSTQSPEGKSSGGARGNFSLRTMTPKSLTSRRLVETSPSFKSTTRSPNNKVELQSNNCKVKGYFQGTISSKMRSLSRQNIEQETDNVDHFEDKREWFEQNLRSDSRGKHNNNSSKSRSPPRPNQAAENRKNSASPPKP